MLKNAADNSHLQTNKEFIFSLLKECWRCHMIGGPVKDVLAKIAATTIAGIVTILSTVRMALAASTDTSLPPEYMEMLRLAQEKVQAATQPGAIGNGVPMLYGADPMNLLPWIGLAVAVAIAAVYATKVLAPKTRNRPLLDI